MGSDVAYPKDTIDNASDNAFAATAHAPYHVTYAQGANFPHIFEIPDPDLPIHYTTFYGATFKANGVISQNSVALC